ncbi:acetolactate synthase small subunit [candidate division KSB1 bacterium]|nr:acetolactate synthase small subunit [candidate division KSB1 bacterium]
MKHIINLEVANTIGVVARVTGMFTARGFNIESISAGRASMEDGSANVTLVVRGDDWVIEQVTKQLNKLIDVIRVSDVTESDFVGRELLLIKINCPPAKRTEVSMITNIFRAKVVDISNRSMTFELTGIDAKITAFIETLRPYGIKEISRSGTIAMVRDSQYKS